MFTALPPRLPTIGTRKGGGFVRPFGFFSSTKSFGTWPHGWVTDASGARNTTMIPITRVCGRDAS